VRAQYRNLVVAVVLLAPTIGAAANMLAHFRHRQDAEVQQTAAEDLQKLSQLKAFCTVSNIKVMRLYPAVRNYPAILKDTGAKADPIAEQRRLVVQKLTDRNYAYLQEIFDGDSTKYITVHSATWEKARANYDELAKVVRAGDFASCIANLDSLLPTNVANGGRK